MNGRLLALCALLCGPSAYLTGETCREEENDDFPDDGYSAETGFGRAVSLANNTWSSSGKNIACCVEKHKDASKNIKNVPLRHVSAYLTIVRDSLA